MEVKELYEKWLLVKNGEIQSISHSFICFVVFLLSFLIIVFIHSYLCLSVTKELYKIDVPETVESSKL